MKKTIIIKEGQKELSREKCEDYMLILSDPGKMKGIITKTSNKSIPRQMGWLMWALEILKHRANKIFKECL